MRFLKTKNGFVVESKISAFYFEPDCQDSMTLFARLIDGTAQRLAVYDGVLFDTVSPEKKQSLILHYLMKNTVDSDKAFAEAKAHAEKAESKTHSVGEEQAKNRRENSHKDSSRDWEKIIAERRKRNRDMFFKHRKSEEKAKDEHRVNLFRFTPDLDDEEDRDSTVESRSHEKEIEDVFKMLFSALEAQKGGHRHV